MVRLKTKYFLLIFALILVPLAALAWNTAIISGGVPSGGDDCPSGTYMFYWDGDHSSGELVACTNSGAGTNTGSNDGTDRVDSSWGEGGGDIAFRYETQDQYIQFTITSWDIFPDPTSASSEGTVWIRVYPVSDAANVDMVFWEVVETSAYNMVYGKWESSGPEVEVYWEGTNNPESSDTGAETPVYGSWQDIGFTWDADLGTNDLCVTIDKGTTWVCDSDGLVEWDASGGTLKIGCLNVTSGNNQEFRLTKFAVINSYSTDGTTCPW